MTLKFNYLTSLPIEELYRFRDAIFKIQLPYFATLIKFYDLCLSYVPIKLQAV